MEPSFRTLAEMRMVQVFSRIPHSAVANQGKLEPKQSNNECPDHPESLF
jgi:hypothetical protein